MHWDEDIDLLAGRKVHAKQGRRSNPNTPEEAGSSELFNTNPFDLDSKEERPEVRPRKTSVWGEEATKSTKSSKSTTNIIELERFQRDTKDITKDDDDIPIIPDIDDVQDDPLNLHDVKPVTTIDKSTYKELDNQLGNIQGDKIKFGNLGNIDLSFLTNRLYPEKEVQIKQEIWTMESLFNDLSRNN
ncbi:intraflagellar transport 43 [Rhynchophorus ferrugineus]|uniref:Intraflagellar transport protein 43 homolog n=1 Tax=Rhynchophorus ferrugineus TaxID=354439 RepID=A0A834HRP1_RHYFE|nr:hypothetical protein GWI33_019440 [Rhynchophorus ferrugineus]